MGLWEVGAKRLFNGVRNIDTKKILLSKAKFAPKQTFFCAAILQHLLVKVFKSETTSFHYFPQGFFIFKFLGHLTLGKGAKRHLSDTSKSEQIDTHTVL